LTAEGSTLGTLGYAPPEQLADGEVGPRADIYGLGALLYALLVGESPLPPAMDPERLAKRLAEWPPTVLSVPELDVVFERALARDPALRYETAAQLAQAARQALS
jgi:serine/threonine protein kinase